MQMAPLSFSLGMKGGVSPLANADCKADVLLLMMCGLGLWSCSFVPLPFASEEERAAFPFFINGQASVVKDMLQEWHVDLAEAFNAFAPYPVEPAEPIVALSRSSRLRGEGWNMPEAYQVPLPAAKRQKKMKKGGDEDTENV